MPKRLCISLRRGNWDMGQWVAVAEDDTGHLVAASIGRTLEHALARLAQATQT